VGGGLGIVLASFAIHLLVAAAPDALPRVHEIHIDGAVLGFTAGISLLTGIIFGILPALHGSAYSAMESLKQGITSSAGAQRQKLRGALVISEIALSLVLLVGAGLLIRSFSRVLDVDPGFRAHGVLTAVVAFPEKGKPDPVQVEAFFSQVYRNLQSQPGVEHAGAATPLPLSGNEWDTGYRVEGHPAPLPGEGKNTRIYHVSADYLATMRIPLLKGRGFRESDIDGTLPVAIVSREFVKRNFPSEDPIGRKLRLGAPKDLSSSDETKFPWITIVGVVGDVKHDSLDSETPIEVYNLYTQHYGGYTQTYRFLVVSGPNQNPLTLAPALRNAVQQANPDVPIASIESMDQLVSDSLGSRKMSMSLLMTFAALALTLAVIGIYGVISYSVTQRTREIGIRMALGARQHEVLSLILRQAFRLVAIGLAIGIGLALVLGFGMSRFLSDQLFGVKASDPVTFVCIAALLSIAALAASGIPARRASKVNPVVALRHE
jgi:ABC-type antimicrobial peptide transport system, permease component